MKFRFLAILILLLPMCVKAEWSFVNKVDDFTDEKVMFTSFSNDEHEIQLSYQDNAVWMFISRKKIGTIEPDGLIELRVDKSDVRLIDPVKSKSLAKLLGRSTFQWEPATVGFLLWHGDESEGCGYVGQLLAGEQLRIRYQTSGLARTSFAVNLEDADKAIIGGLALTKCGNAT
jgi:hypothetical protein